MAENKFEWVDFYKEFAQKLLEYKDNREELIQKVIQIFELTELNLPTLETDNNIVDIDPFTVFGLFNKGIKHENKIKILTAIKELFTIKSKVPEGFAGIPVVNKQGAAFYYFINDRNDDDIDAIWKLFEEALKYSEDKSETNKEKLENSFNRAIKVKGVGNAKLTMGLFWVAPETYINLDRVNIEYIYKSNKLPEDVVSKLPKIKGKINFKTYIEIIETLKSFLDSGRTDLNSFKELSYTAWIYANKKDGGDDGSLDSGNNVNSGDETSDKEIDDKLKEKYTKEDFLNDVFMSEKNYNSLVNLLKNKKNIILQGAPGVGKTYIAKRLAYSIMGVKDEERVSMVQFHQSYSYEDFVEGYRPSSEDSGFEIRKGTFYNFCKKASNDIENDYFFIIDEINRGNLSKILGELFMLIENDKRGEKLKLTYSDEDFSVPENLYIIGMMNTADRSLALIDYALRRRFSFFNMEPSFDSEGFRKYQEQLDNKNFDLLIDRIKELNKEIADDRSLGKGFYIGHSFFCNFESCSDEDIVSIIDYEIIPLLNEYWFDDDSKLDYWINRLKDIIDV